MKDPTKIGMAKKVRPLLALTLMAFAIVMTLEFFFPIVPKTGAVEKYAAWQIASYALFFIGGVIVFLLKNKSTYIIVGTATITLGIADMVSQTMALIESAKLTSIVYLILTAIFALIPLMDLFLAMFSVRYMQGHKRNAIRMSVCIGAVLITWILFFILAALMARHDMAELMSVLLYYIPSVALYAIFFVTLLSPGIREDLTEWRLYDMSEDMYKTMIVDPKSSMYRGDLLALNETLSAPEKWEESKTVPNSKECHALFGKDMNIRRMTFVKLDGSDKIRVSIIEDGEKAYIQGARFDFHCMLPLEGDLNTCKSVRFVGEKGYFIDISVRDDTPVPHKTYLIDRVIDRMKIHKRFSKKKKD